MNFKAISLFSGAGGMDVGFSKAGFKIVWANDNNKDACETFKANHGDIIECGNLENFLPKLSSYEGGVDLVFGGPPCQGFSVAGKMDANDQRSKLVFSFMDVLAQVKPRAFVMENVKALGFLSKWGSVREALFKRAADLGYTFRQILILNSADFGVPQKRERMLFIGIKDAPSINEITGIAGYFNKYKSKAPRVGQIFSQLGRAGTSLNPNTCNAKITTASNPILRRSPYAGMLFNGAGRPIDPNGYANTLPASMGGNKTPIVDEAQVFDGQPSWVENYHKKLWTDKQITDFQGAPKFLRRLTIAEAQRIQTFPDNYKFMGGTNSIYKQIGNAVPCNLAYIAGRVVKEILLSQVEQKASQNIFIKGSLGATV